MEWDEQPCKIQQTPSRMALAGELCIKYWQSKHNFGSNSCCSSMDHSHKLTHSTQNLHIPELNVRLCTNPSRRRGKSSPMLIRLQRHIQRSARRGHWICVRRTSSHSTIREKLSFQSSNCKFNKNHFLKENPLSLSTEGGYLNRIHELNRSSNRLTVGSFPNH